MRTFLRHFCLLFAPLFHAAAEDSFGPYAEPAMPFLESTVDFRDWEKLGFHKNNLVVRGMILKLPGNVYVCYDTDLLRVAGIWEGAADGQFLTETSIAAISYHTYNKKSEGGQKDLPKPVGRPIYASPPRMDWESGWTTKDPRPIPADARELGRGAIPAHRGHWDGVGTDGSVHFTFAKCPFEDTWSVLPDGKVIREIHNLPEGIMVVRWLKGDTDEPEGLRPMATGGIHKLTYGTAKSHRPRPTADLFSATIKAPGVLGAETGAYAIDDLPLPLANPAHRNVRLSGIDFFPDGRAVGCTIDGDIWVVSGLSGNLADATWQRIASGLSEPQSVAVADGQIYTFTRNGIIRLKLGATGIAEFYETFCNAYVQTAETREFPMDMVKKPGGGFYIAKGGQQLTTKGEGAGRIYEVSADGRSVKEICNGLRQPYLGIHPVSGRLSASDQQGNYIPSTPIHLIEPGAFYGFPEGAPSPAPATVTEATCWIPHELNQSAAGQVWAVGGKLGSLDGHLLHLGYFKSAVFETFLPNDGQQAAVVPLPWKLDIPLLKGAVHPVDRSLYLCGLQIWGADAAKISGLKRVRATGRPNPQPTDVRCYAEGIVLSFAEPLDEFSLAAPGAFLVQRWNYRRTPNYGSAHYRLDGQPGHDFLPVVGAVLSDDGRSVFLRVDDLQPVMQLQVEWNVQTVTGLACKNLAACTIRALGKLDFGATHISPALLQAPAIKAENVAANFTPTAEAGHTLALQLGCLSCHSINGSMEGMKGPSWQHLFGSEVTLTTGKKVTADAAYVQESILNPTAKVRQGFASPDTGMPPYLGILSEAQVQAIVLYFQSLR